MSDGTVRLEYQGHVALITLDRQAKRNAFDETMWHALEQSVSQLKSKLPRVIIVTGAGKKAFCAGFDVNPDNPQVGDLIGSVEKHDREPVAVLIKRIRKALDDLVFLPVPIIAALNGSAHGGGAELAVRCDLRVMEPVAAISFSEVRLGLMPDWGGGVALTRLIGPSRAAELILCAHKVSADEALRIGLVNRIAAPGKVLEEALNLAQTIACNGPRAVRSALKVIRNTPDLSYREALDLETELAVNLITSGECIHGISAFLMKQEPQFPDE
ncbi:MAG: enoyl-CoA hydratase/isomerase family protein [Deltaproteobacteria bacterium]|nr:enoyl-CoA hydratase/isomerase family protein [Deltaproteobacteria bacterium]